MNCLDTWLSSVQPYDAISNSSKATGAELLELAWLSALPFDILRND